MPRCLFQSALEAIVLVIMLALIDMLNVVIVTRSVADPYHFDTDPDPGCEKIRYGSGSGSRVNFDTDPDPGKNDTDPDPDPAKKA